MKKREFYYEECVRGFYHNSIKEKLMAVIHNNDILALETSFIKLLETYLYPKYRKRDEKQQEENSDEEMILNCYKSYSIKCLKKLCKSSMNFNFLLSIFANEKTNEE